MQRALAQVHRRQSASRKENVGWKADISRVAFGRPAGGVGKEGTVPHLRSCSLHRLILPIPNPGSPKRPKKELGGISPFGGNTGPRPHQLGMKLRVLSCPTVIRTWPGSLCSSHSGPCLQQYPPHSRSTEGSMDFSQGCGYTEEMIITHLFFKPLSLSPDFHFHSSCYNSSPKERSRQALLPSSGLFLSFFACLDSSYLHSHPSASQNFRTSSLWSSKPASKGEQAEPETGVRRGDRIQISKKSRPSWAGKARHEGGPAVVTPSMKIHSRR